MGVTVQLLGGFTVEIDGLTVTTASFERRVGADLVALLALAPRRRLHRDQIIDALWPDASPSSGTNRLNKAATFARNALGRSNAVVAENDGLTLLPDDDVWIDATAVEEGDGHDTRVVEAAAAGPLLPDLLYKEWTIESRNRLRLRQLEVLRSASRWEQVLVLDPTDETAHLSLMKRDLARGEREAVLRRFELLEEVLQSELGILPSESAVTLRDRALAASPSEGASSNHLTRTFLMTDLAGSAQRWHDEPEVMTTVLARHDELLAGALAQHGGDVFRHAGDGLCAAFESATSAVKAAIEGQRRVQSEDWPSGHRVQIRMGLDTGEAQSRDGHWFGRPLDRAARVMDAGSGDQILCAPSVAELAAVDDESGVQLTELGLFRLAGLAPLRLYRITAPDLLTASAPPRSMRVGGQPLQLLRTMTFGRDRVRDELVAELAGERLVTLTGPGGAGKTHLARHVGGEVLDRHVGGAWFCQLGSVDGDAAAAQAVLSAIGGIQHGSTSVTDSIISTLGDREILLLVDNCEHVIDGIGRLLDQVLSACPGVTVLATSREPLGINGERVHRIEPLDRTAAIELFVSEAGRHGQPIDADDPVVGRICDRLDDLPMALRLAAARARSLDLVTLESLLADRFEFLADRESGGLAHQQTLRTTIAWSVNALEAPARAFLIALGAFAARFDMDDIAAVTATAPLERITMVDTLIQRSLLIGPEPSDIGPHYRLLESVRLYVREELTDEVRGRHVEHLVSSTRTWQTRVGAPNNGGVLWFANRWDDIRLAVTTATTLDRREDALAILAATGLYGNISMRFEMLEWFAALLDPASTSFGSPAEAKAYAGWAVLSNFHGDWELADRLAGAVVAAEPDLAEAAWAKSWMPYTRGDLDEARQWLDRVIDNPDPAAYAVKFGAYHTRANIDFSDGLDTSEVAHLLDVLSVDLGASARSLALGTRALAAMWTDGQATIADAEACIELSDRFGLVNSSITGRTIRAFAMVVHGSVEQALESVVDAEAFASERGLWHWALSALGTAGGAFERAGRPDAAATVLGVRAGAGYRSGFSARFALLQEDRLRRQHPEQFETWWASGHGLSPAEAAAFVVTTANDLL